VEEFSASRSSRKILPGLQASVAAADTVSCGSKDHVDRLVEIVKQAHVVYDNLRRGEGEVLTSSIQMQLHKCWDGFVKLPCRDGDTHLKEISELVAEAKILLPMDDQLHAMAGDIAKRQLQVSKASMEQDIIQAATLLRTGLDSKPALEGLSTTLTKARGLRMNMSLPANVEDNAVAHVRVMILFQVSGNWVDANCDLKLEVVDYLNQSAQNHPDEL
jgi:hypothetical protein